MSQIVTCPDCGHEFKVSDRSEQFEELAAQMVNGNIAPKQTCGYDIIDNRGMKYQVKYSIANRKRERWHWSFRFRINGTWPDYFILYGIDGKEVFCFLLSTRRFFEASNRTRDFSVWLLSASTLLSSWIWDYRVTPETFYEKLSMLISVGEFTMSLDSNMPALVSV